MENGELRKKYDELLGVAKTMQQRAVSAEQRLAAVNVTVLRLEYLFKILDHKDFFSAEYLDKCSSEIEELMSQEEEKKEEAGDGEKA